MFHCISHGKIPYNALQIYLIFYALLFLSVAASRMADGISRIIDSIWLMSIFFVPTRDNTRTHVGENACRCEFNYFRSEAQALSSALRKFNVPETRAGARLRRGKRWELCSDVRYTLLSTSWWTFSVRNAMLLQRFLMNRLKRNWLHRRESLFDEVEPKNAA